jgi:uncharacterized protein YegL
MSNFNQVPFGGVEFAQNPTQRVPCVLLLDTSYSMDGNKIDALNEGLVTFANELQADGMAAQSAEVAIVNFGPVRVIQDFVTAENFFPMTLSADNATPMGEAILKGIELTRERKDQYKAAGITYYRPWIFLITDGAPTDNISQAKLAIADGESKNEFHFYAVGVDGADMAVLRDLSSKRKPVELKGLLFREMFQWLSASIGTVSRSQRDEDVQLDNPFDEEDGWAVISS